jgi:cell division protein FtsB
MRRLTPLWIFIFIFAAGAIFLPGVSKYLKLKRKEEQLAKDIKRLETQINDLKQEEYLLKTDVTRLEEIVRSELGLVRPGEVIYRAVEDKPQEQVPASKKQASTSTEKPPKKQPAQTRN